ncbi:hypothetical protein ACT691_08870 [Vibrio metschnikovii]
MPNYLTAIAYVGDVGSQNVDVLRWWFIYLCNYSGRKDFLRLQSGVRDGSSCCLYLAGAYVVTHWSLWLLVSRKLIA